MINKDNLKAKLEEERLKLVSELQSMATFNEDTGIWNVTLEESGEMESDLNEVDDKNEEYEIRSSSVDVLSARLSKVDKALSVVDTDQYGKCEVCGGEISKERLDVNAAATTCKEHLED